MKSKSPKPRKIKSVQKSAPALKDRKEWIDDWLDRHTWGGMFLG